MNKKIKKSSKTANWFEPKQCVSHAASDEPLFFLVMIHLKSIALLRNYLFS
jgi:hypothetical protein